MEASPVSMPTFSGPRSSQREKNFSDGAGVEGGLPLAERLEVEAQRHQRLAGAGGGVEDDVLAGHDLQQRLLLGRIQLKPRLGRPVHEPVEDLVRIGRAAGRHPGDQGRAGGLESGLGHGRGIVARDGSAAIIATR
jgi:hypothetical protein